MMAVTFGEILGSDGENRPLLPLARQSRDALARYCAIRWPVGRRKAIQTEWRLTAEEARAVAEASAGPATLDRVWKAGGWGVVLPVMAAVIGQPVSDFFRDQIREVERAHERATECEALARKALSRAAGPLVEAGEDGGVDRRRVRREPSGRHAGRGAGRAGSSGVSGGRGPRRPSAGAR